LPLFCRSAFLLQSKSTQLAKCIVKWVVRVS
jgi:hypothetical protein